MVSTHTWHISLFGPLRVYKDLDEVRIPAGKGSSLLAYLLLHPNRAHSREQLTDLLWQELPPDRGRRALTYTLYRLRETPAHALIDANAEEVALNARESLFVDLWQFEALRQVTDADLLDNALAIATAPLLPEVYEDWIVPRRLQVQNQHLQLLVRRAGLAEAFEDYERATTLYQQAIERDNLDEALWRGLMRAQARTGRLHEALQTYQRLEAQLRDELNVVPEAESAALAGQLRTEYDFRRSRSEPTLFVGRLAERARLVASLEAAIGGAGRYVILLAQRGMGRTALLEEIARSAQWRGVRVIWGYGAESALPEPHAPLMQALRSALPSARLKQLQHLVPEPWLELVRLALAHSPQTPYLESSELAFNHLGMVIANVLRALSEVRPHLFLLDDLQWAEPTIWPLLDAMLPVLRRSRMLVVLSSVQAGIPVKYLSRWDHASAGELMALEGMSRSEIGELLANQGLLQSLPSSGIDSSAKQRTDAVATIHAESGGNPLLALALASAEMEKGLGDSLSIAVARTRERLLAALGDLPVSESEAVEVASILGNQFAWEHWVALWRALGKQPDGLVRIAGSLEQRRIILLDDEHYRFASGALCAAVHDRIPAQRREQLHQLAYRILRDTGDVADRMLLFHAMHGALREATFHHALQAGTEALASHSASSALELFELAEAHQNQASQRDLYHLWLGFGRALGVLGERERQRDAIETAAKLAQNLGEPALLVEAGYEMSRHCQTLGALDESLRCAEQAMLEAEQSGLDAWCARLHERLGRVQRDRKESRLAREHLSQANLLYQQVGDPWGVAMATDALGGLAWDIGDYRASATYHGDAADHFGKLGDLVSETQSLNNRGTALWELGDYESARVTHERCIEICRATGDRMGEGDNLSNLGGVYWIWGEYDKAIALYREALRIRRAIHDRRGIAISLGNIGSALLRKGNVREAIQHYVEALPIYVEVGRPRGQAYVLHHLGVAWMETGDTRTALSYLGQALQMRQAIGDQGKIIETHAAMGLALAASGEDARALESIAHAISALNAGEFRAELCQQVHCAAWQIFARIGDTERALHHLGLAELALEELAGAIHADERASFLVNVPINRTIAEGVAEHAKSIVHSCTRKPAETGSEMHVRGLVATTFTVATPGDQQVTDAAKRRQRVLRRILLQAERQGALLTDDACAQLLGVSRRTILRDREALAGST